MSKWMDLFLAKRNYRHAGDHLGVLLCCLADDQNGQILSLDGIYNAEPIPPQVL